MSAAALVECLKASVASLTAQPAHADLGAKTPEQVKAEFERAGISIAQWAKANGFDRMTVYGVLSGRHRGSRGKTHQIAVALGLKDGVIVAAKDFRPIPAMAEAA